MNSFLVDPHFLRQPLFRSAALFWRGSLGKGRGHQSPVSCRKRLSAIMKFVYYIILIIYIYCKSICNYMVYTYLAQIYMYIVAIIVIVVYTYLEQIYMYNIVVVIVIVIVLVIIYNSIVILSTHITYRESSWNT